jgi:hypothetical protein
MGVWVTGGVVSTVSTDVDTIAGRGGAPASSRDPVTVPGVGIVGTVRVVS